MKYTIYFFFTNSSANFSFDADTEESMNVQYDHITAALDKWNRPYFINKIFSRVNYYTIQAKKWSTTISLNHLVMVQKKITE